MIKLLFASAVFARRMRDHDDNGWVLNDDGIEVHEREFGESHHEDEWDELKEKIRDKHKRIRVGKMRKSMNKPKNFHKRKP